MTFATIEKIEEGFRAASKEIKNVEDDLSLGIKETRDTLIEIQKQLRNLRQGGFSQAGGDKGSFWPTEEMAKSFGELVLIAASKKAMGEVSQAGGSALVSPEMTAWVIDKLGQYGKFRRDAMVVPMGSDSLLVPKVESDLTIYCPGESAEIAESDMKFSQVALTARKLCCLAKVSSELEEDAVIALGEIVGLSMARSLAKKEDAIGFLGDGTSTYFGMTGICGALLAVSATIANIKSLVVGSGNLYSELTLGDFRKVIGVLPDDADDGARWYMAKKFYYEVVYPLAETAGVANIFEILSDKKGRFLLGYPVEFVSAMPSTQANSQICAILADLRLGAFLGERRDMRLERSDQRFFTSDQIGFRGVERISINCYGVGDTTDAGPICGLITAAT